MFFTSKQIQEATESTLIEFLSLKAPEGQHLDYKRTLSGTSMKDAYREFLKDVTSFANASGGTILLGCLEPADDQQPTESLIGIDEADSVRGSLERLSSSCIDQRISDLTIVAVPLTTGKKVILVHVPPSISRPHMVNHDSHRTFYIRRGESSFPMTTHEIRETVMASYSVSENALRYCERKEEETKKYYPSRYPYFLIQSIPLVTLDKPWPVFSNEFGSLAASSSRGHPYPELALSTPFGPRPTIEGIMTFDNRDDFTWMMEFHRSGYVQLLFQNRNYDFRNESKPPLLSSEFRVMFDSYFDIHKDLWDLTGTDLPYLIRVQYLNARNTVMSVGSRYPRNIPYLRDEIQFPIHVRQSGEEVTLLVDELTRELFNAFGFKDIVK